jgi:hypothetical protein
MTDTQPKLHRVPQALSLFNGKMAMKPVGKGRSSRAALPTLGQGRVAKDPSLDDTHIALIA